VPQRGEGQLACTGSSPGRQPNSNSILALTSLNPTPKSL
jgi:hypothetical protein